MSDLTRRGFVKSSAATTAGMTVFGGLLVEDADAKADKEAQKGEPGRDPVVAYVKDPSSGVVTVMAGHREVNLHDPKLAARIAHAAR